MKHTRIKRLMAWTLSAALLITQFSAPVYAQATTIEGCTHHTEHTTDCGYTEGAACTHEHDENCGNAEAVEGTACNHIDNHDTACGYTEGTPCTFECPQCNPKDSGNVALGMSSITVTAFDKLEDAVQQQTVPVGTKLTALDLPTTLAASGFTVSDTKVVDSGTPSDTATTPAAISIEGVAWKIDPTNDNNQGNDTYDPEQGAYCFTPILPKGYTLAESVKLPEIWVMVGGVNLLAATTYGAFSVTTASGTVPTYASNVLTLGSGTYTIAMKSGATSTSADKIVVSTGVTANITLDGVNISVGGCAFELQGNAKVNLTLKGTNILKSGNNRAGLQVQTKDSRTATLIITKESTGSLNATGGAGAAGIGGISDGNTVDVGSSSGGNITINGGTITATSLAGEGDPAAIGGGAYGDTGTISITGGHVTANGSGKGIGGGAYRSSGSISISGGVVIANGIGIGGWDASTNTIITGNSFVVSGSGGINQTNKTNWSGVIFGGETDTSTGAIYGTSITLKTDAEIPVGKTLTIANGKTLIIDTTVSLTNRGTIVNNGTFTNNGKFNNYGEFTGTPPTGSGAIAKASQVLVTFKVKTGGGYGGNPVATAQYGDTIQITASASEKAAVTSKMRSATINTVDFYLSSIDDGNKLGTGSVNSGVATLEITLTGDKWNIGNKKIIADFGGVSGSWLESTGEATLTVTRADQSPTDIAVSSKTPTYGGTAPTITPVTVSDSAKVTYTAVDNTTSGGAVSEVASINGTTITIKKAGTFYVKAVIEETTNYNAKTIYSAPITVAKGDALTLPEHEIKFSATLGGSGNVNIAALLYEDKPTAYELKTITGDSGIISNAQITNNGILTFTVSTGAAGSTATIPVKVTSANYNNATLNVKVTLTNPVSISDADLIFKSETCPSDCAGHFITGTSTGGKIIVESGAHNITLNNVDIDVSTTDNACAFDLQGNAKVNLTLVGTNTLKSGGSKAGLQVPNGATLTIGGTGSLNATGGNRAAGIGGSESHAGGTITINGGTVTATGSLYGAGIGGGDGGAGGTITISGGTVTAIGSNGGAGIGGGINGTAGTFSTGTGGNAFIMASSIGDKRTQSTWRGVIFEGTNGLVYGSSIALATDAEITVGKTLTIGTGKTLTINEGVTLTNNGTITVDSNGTLINNGSIKGTAPTGGGAINTHSDVVVTFAVKTGSTYGSPVATASYGDTIKITATASRIFVPKGRSAAINTVDFYLSSIDDGNKLGTGSVSNNVATLEITLDEAKWKPSETPYTIIADFGGTSGLFASTGTGTLKVNKGTQAVVPSVTFFFDGNNANKLMGATNLMEYSLDGGTIWANCTADIDLTSSLSNITADKDIKIRMTATATHSAGVTQTIDITKAATPALNPTQPSTIDGKGSIPMTSVHEYSSNNGSTWTAATGTTTELAVGTYYVRVKATGTVLASEAQTITLTAFTGTQEATPTATFTATSEKDGTLANVTTAMKYSVDGTNWNAITNTSMVITDVTPSNGVKIKQLGNGSTTTDSEVQAITVTKAATPALGSTQPSTIGGKGSIPMTSAHEYSSNNGSTWTAATGTTNLAAGTYHVRVKAASAVLASAGQEITLTAFVGTQENTPNATFTATGADSGTLANVTTAMKYSVDGGTNWNAITNTSMEITNVTTTNDVKIKQLGNGSTTTDSEVQTITVTKAATPALGSTQPSTIGGKGSIPMTANLHEYKSDNGSTWTAVTGTTELSAGTYHVRVKATGTVLASDGQEITLTAFIATKEATPTATFTATSEKGGTLTNVTTAMKYSVDGGTNWNAITNTSMEITNVTTTNDVKIKQLGNGSTTTDSEVQAITITKATTPALTPTQPNTIDGKGSIPMTSAHEYSSNNGSTWTAATGTTTELAVGTYYVRVKATGTVLASEAQTITLKEKVNAVAPTISTNLATTEVTYTVDATSTPLSIEASATDGGTLSYEWFSNTTNSTTGGSSLTGATGKSYTPLTTTAGTTYYYCVVTNTITDNGDGGTKTATTTSKVANIKVNAALATVTNVEVSPATANVQKGATQRFNATVTGNNSPAQTVTWEVTGGTAGTSINGGLLTVAADETATSLTVTATSTVDTTQKGTATVTVTTQPVAKYTLTVNGGTGSGSYEADASVSATANSASSGQRFKEWTATGITLANKTQSTITIIMPAEAVTLTAVYESIPAGGDSGGDASSSTTPPKDTTSPTNGNVKPPVTVDGNGNATTKIPDDKVQEAIQKAVEQAQKDGTTANGIVISVTLDVKIAANSLTAALSRPTLDRLIEAKVENLALTSGFVNLRFDLEALKQMRSQSTGEVAIKVVRQDVKKLSTAAQTTIGNRPAMEITASWQNNGKVANITNFGKGSIAIGIPYTKTATEQTGYLYGVYVDSKGAVTYITNSSFDTGSKMLMLTTNHLSVYGVGYKAPTTVFTDIAKHWAKNDIDFVAARGLLSGTGKTTFSPDTSMTRGMFVTALGRLAGVDTKKYSNTKFTDVKADAYYSPYVAWANVNNIVNGTTATTFSPDQSITRQEMAVMLVNYSKAIGYKLPSVHAQVTFTDSASIGTWAKDAVKQMQMAGILMGKSGNKFDPTATATRAEVSAMLRRYVELVVSTETAEGWAMNESGQWMYIQDGKRVTGKKTVDGKAYEFDQYGVTTALLPERKYGIHTVQIGESFWSVARKYKVSMFELATVNGKSIFSIIYAGEELKIPQK